MQTQDYVIIMLMKKTKLLLPLVSLITLSQVAHALELPIVSKYNEAESAQVWLKSKADQVPAALLGTESVANPMSSYSAIFPKSFLQDQLFAVCYQDCNSKDIFRLKDGEIADRDKDNWNVIEQANVYYWLNRYFNFLETRLNFRPTKHLKVITNREIHESGKKLMNNAFFNPQDTSLTFLPANKSMFFKLMAGKLNRSGFDPSIIVHEASHYVFDHLFPDSVNEEIGGLNEGFADYLANIFLDNPKFGLIMLQGKAIRDASDIVASDKKMKLYEPSMEVHDLGERVAYALWETRKLTQDKEEFDRLVIDAVIDLNTNPYSAIHDFKEKMLTRLETHLDSNSLSNAQTIWELVFAGQAIKLDNTEFLTSSIPSKSFVGFKVRQILPAALAKGYGIDPIQESSFSLLKIQKVSDFQVAILAAKETETLTTPYWTVLDTQRGNILGIYGLDKKLITETKEIEEAKKVANQAIEAQSKINDFTKKVANFSLLLEGKGEFAIAFKVKSVETKESSVKFNGELLSGRSVEIALKRKMLVGLLGVPNIDKVTLYTIPGSIKGLPTLNEQAVVGYKVQLPDGTETETILDKFSPAP